MKTLLDASEDRIDMSTLMAFEMGWLLEQKPAFYLPVIDYLFRVLYRQFKQRHPALLILDEGWLYLDNPYFAKKLKDWFKTLRKFNVAIIIATQSLQDAVQSEISAVLLESCKTKIYLPNDAMTDASRAMYQFCGLNERQIDMIASAKPKRDYYVVNPRDNRLITLGLGALTLALIGVAKKEDIEIFLQLYDRKNPSWIAKWLEYKNLPNWSAHFRHHYAEVKSCG
jgi:type IV secretion system protein VirB4